MCNGLKLILIVSYDTGYDDAGRSLTAVSCSDGTNGLITKYGWSNQGSVAGFPRIGGYVGVGGWNSPQVCDTKCALISSLLTTFSTVRYLLRCDLQRQDSIRSCSRPRR
jgi:hypothetical protein